jgi:predicted nuclease of predicted toxin-antitoxin system
MQFHLDEHVAHAVAAGLRRRGIDVTTTADAGLISRPDEMHLEFARRERRVIVTQDSDFLRFAANAVDHFGVVYYPHDARSIGDVIRHLTLMHDVLADDEMVGRLEYL